MTDLERAWAAEHAARLEAERKNQLKDQFLAAVSHELRAPLTTMLLWERILRDETATPDLHAQALDAIHQSVLVQSRLIGDLLDVSRAISGKLHVDTRTIEIGQLIREAVDAVAVAASTKHLALDRDVPATLGEIDGDPFRMRQVLDNLLSNAIKFTSSGGRISVTATGTSRSIAITVADTGRGIERELLARLFEPFSQGDDLSTRAQGGLGLGLTIAHQLVVLQGGTLVAASPGRGQGAAFTITLPTSRSRRTASPPLGVAATTALVGMSILVVDDDARVRAALVHLLRDTGANVEAADGADTARELLARALPDVIVCDIAMPGEDGCTFVAGLRRTGCTIPAIALTAQASTFHEQRALAAGFDVHLAKPIPFERLMATLTTVIDDSRSRTSK